MRCKIRFEYADIGPNEECPILLSNKARYARLVIKYTINCVITNKLEQLDS